MALELVAEGDISTIDSAADVDASLPEGTEAEFQVFFSSRFPLFSETASAFNITLAALGVAPWSGVSRLVYADPSAALWSIRYTKGFPWLGVIIGALLALSIALFIIFWKLFTKVLEMVLSSLPWLMAVIGGIVGGLWLARRLRRASV